MSGNRNQVTWDVVKSFTANQVLVEVSSSSTLPKRFSYRITWTEGDKRGAWFPDRSISFLDDMGKAVAEAEGWILDERAKELAEYESRIQERKEREADKRKRHTDNVERRKDENRRMASRSSR